MNQKRKSHFKKLFSNVPVLMVFAVLLIIGVASGILNLRKTVTVIIDGNEKQLVTYKSQLNDIFSDNNISIGTKDKISRNIDSKVSDGDKIYIKKAVNIKVNAAGKIINVLTSESNINNMLKTEKIEFDENDKISPSINSEIKDGMTVSIVKVDTKVVIQDKDLSFFTIVKNDSNLLKGTKKVIQSGKNGSKKIQTKIVYENGKEVSKKVISETIVSKPISQIIAVGTMGVVTPSRGGSYNYSKTMRVTATAYSACKACTGKNPGDPAYGITATGTVARRNSSGYSTIAVDPRVIPFGTKVYIEGYGLAIAEDTGGAIKGNKIDLFMNSYSDAVNWGLRSVNVYVLK